MRAALAGTGIGTVPAPKLWRRHDRWPTAVMGAARSQRCSMRTMSMAMGSSSIATICVVRCQPPPAMHEICTFGDIVD